MSFDGKPPELNISQWNAVRHSGGHLLIVAGPGTGKNHTLTHRIARFSHQLQSGQKALAITFTRKAAEELKERLSKHSPETQNKIFVGTFHSFCLAYLREHVEGITIAAADDLEGAARQLWPDLPKRQLKKKLQSLLEYKTRHLEGQAPPELSAYNQILRANRLWDFDDLLLEATKFLADVNKTEFVHVFVDEYQDINALQHAFLKELLRCGATLTAIGDPHQAIYGFRGADVSFFKRFVKDFPGATILSLSDNYRSAPNLLKASGQIVARETPLVGARTADMYSHGQLMIYEAATDKAEAEYVVHQIEKLVGGTSLFSQDSGRVAGGVFAQRSFNDIAVLYRLNAQKLVLEEALGRHGIPYQTSDERPFADLEPIPELMAFLKGWRNAGPLSVAIGKLPETAAENPAHQKNIERFVRMSKRFRDVQEFLDYLTLQQPEDSIERRAENVHLLTLHAAKGLEFSVVFIIGCEQNLLPLSLEGMRSDPDEERRLFYVGMTRAKEALYLTHARRRRLFGQRMSPAPSVYLDDIAQELKEYDRAQLPSRRKSKPLSTQMELFP